MIEKRIRCAIYTRKSTDEGLDMEFNSLDAQREAGEAFIASQRFKNWECLPERYDDGGFSGGNTNRPALAKLKEDIAEGKIDAVVVYKIDRLSRSLMDFAELLTLFEKYGVAFVSVTQDINTSSSSGRMMLNILMTFAQYEREVITERIKDKISAAKKRGMHCGGPPPLGYKSAPESKKLEVIPEEAELVKRIFSSYLQKGSARDVAEELDLAGFKTKMTVSKKGITHGGKQLTPAYIYQVLQNPIYIGLVKHYKETYPGEHQAIIEKSIWDAAQKLLSENLVHDGKMQKRLIPLRGLIRCGCCNGAMTESYTKKSSKQYRYFVCEKDIKQLHSSCPLKRVPVAELENLLLREIGSMLAKPEIFAGVMHEAGGLDEYGRHLKLPAVQKAFDDLTNVWDVMFPVEKYKFINEIIAGITVFPDRVEIEYKTDGLEAVITETEKANGKNN